MPWYSHLLYYWRVAPSTYLPRIYLYTLIFIYDHLWGLFFLWESFLFMRIPSYLLIICENFFCLWKYLLIYDHLWESLLIYDQLFYYLFFITLTHLCVLILIFFYHSKSILICMHSSWSVRIENLHEHK